MFGTFYVERIILVVKKQAYIKHFNGAGREAERAGEGSREEDPSSIENS